MKTFFPWLLFPLLCSLLFGETNLSWQVSPDKTKPGDLIELIATIESDSLSNAEITWPRHHKLQLIDQSAHSTDYDSGRYFHRIRFVLQAVSSGSAIIAPIPVRLQFIDRSQEAFLPELTIPIAPYRAADTDATAASLPAPSSSSNSAQKAVIVALAIVVVIGGIVIQKKRCAANPGEDNDTSDALEDLCRALKNDQDPTPLVENYLATHTASLSPELQATMEQFVYGSDCNHELLANLLEKEVGS
ncbi:MAG: hypothetical protein AAFX93_10110 [Verrucomicrobiota bacterium]